MVFGLIVSFEKEENAIITSMKIRQVTRFDGKVEK